MEETPSENLISEIQVTDQKKGLISAKDAKLIVLLIFILIGGYLYTANNFKFFPFSAKTLTATSDKTNDSQIGATQQPQESQKTNNSQDNQSDITKRERSENSTSVKIQGDGGALTLEMPADLMILSDNAIFSQYLPVLNKPTLIVNSGFDRGKMADTWNDRLIYLDFYGKNESGDAKLRRDSMLESLKMIGDKSGESWQYSSLIVADLYSFKREMEIEGAQKNRSVVEYYLVTENSVYLASEIVWRSKKETDYSNAEIRTLLSTALVEELNGVPGDKNYPTVIVN